MVYFQNAQKSHGKTLRFTRNNESEREFFKKYPQVNFLLIRAFSALIFEFKITNHPFIEF